MQYITPQFYLKDGESIHGKNFQKMNCRYKDKLIYLEVCSHFLKSSLLCIASYLSSFSHIRVSHITEYCQIFFKFKEKFKMQMKIFYFELPN